MDRISQTVCIVIGLILLALVFTGCAKISGQVDGNVGHPAATPAVRAQDGASASITFILCPPNDLRAIAVGELIQLLMNNDELVSARSGGSARLLINACPFEELARRQSARRR